MQSLYNADVYTDEVREMILESGHIGIEIANRWMMGWPKRVVNLMIQDMYEDVFQNQLLQEQDAIARASNLSHLAPMEIVVMSGLNLEPPERVEAGTIVEPATSSSPYLKPCVGKTFLHLPALLAPCSRRDGEGSLHSPRFATFASCWST